MDKLLTQHSGRLESIGTSQDCYRHGAGFHCQYTLRIGDKDLQLWIEAGLKDAIEPLVGSTVSLFVLYAELIAVTTEDKAFKTYAATVIPWVSVIVLLPLASVFFWYGLTDPVAFLPLLLFLWVLRGAWRAIAVGRVLARFPNAVVAIPVPNEDSGI